MRFQDGCDKYMTSNQLTFVTVDRISVIEEVEAPTIPKKSEEAVYLEKGYYHVVYFLLHVNKEDGFNRN